jgi:hypothetical protein
MKKNNYYNQSDPKSLWKNIESDKSTFWKDNVAVQVISWTKKIVVASKRGRSHMNVGSFRDDVFCFQILTIQG